MRLYGVCVCVVMCVLVCLPCNCKTNRDIRKQEFCKELGGKETVTLMQYLLSCKTCYTNVVLQTSPLESRQECHSP